jgi:hypothetical protein
MARRLTGLAYALFVFVLILPAVAVTGAALAGLDRESLWSSFLITNTVIG